MGLISRSILFSAMLTMKFTSGCLGSNFIFNFLSTNFPISRLISDFIDSGFADALRIANHKHDVIALHVFDKRERELPDVGFIRLRDAETNQHMWIDTSDKATRKRYSETWMNADAQLKEIFTRTAVDNVRICTDEDYVKPLIQMFKQR